MGDLSAVRLSAVQFMQGVGLKCLHCIPEAKEVLDLLVGGCGRNALDVDGGAFRHDV